MALLVSEKKRKYILASELWTFSPVARWNLEAMFHTVHNKNDF
jgi:hypothetical protein